MHCQHFRNLGDVYFKFFGQCDRRCLPKFFGYTPCHHFGTTKDDDISSPQNFFFGATTACKSTTACLILSPRLRSPKIVNGYGYVLLYDITTQKCFMQVVEISKIEYYFCIHVIAFLLLFSFHFLVFLAVLTMKLSAYTLPPCYQVCRVCIQ